MRRTILHVALLVICATGFAANGNASGAGQRTLKVGVSIFEPLVMEKGTDLTGFSVDLWNEVAGELNADTEFRVASFEEKLALTRDGRVDVSVGGITISEEREAYLDFGVPTMNSGLKMLVRKETTKQNVIPIIAKRLFTWEIFQMTGLLLIIMLVLGLPLWLAEKGSDVIRDRFKDGYPDAVWCTWMIKTTIGFGDVFPKKLLGRILTIPIFFLGLVLVGVVSAPIISAFTVRDIEAVEARISHPSDLLGRVAATKKGTYSVEAVREYGARRVIECKDIDVAYQRLLDGEADVVVYDAPGILHFEENEGRDKVVSVGSLFKQHYNAFAYPAESALREDVNRVLLRFYEDGTYNRIYAEWFGEK